MLLEAHLCRLPLPSSTCSSAFALWQTGLDPMTDSSNSVTSPKRTIFIEREKGLGRRSQESVLTLGSSGALYKGYPVFATLFGIEGVPNAMQKQMEELPLDKQLIIIESETGSGKTEAALLRFAHMFQAGLVDGLYFALPTRTAATQIHGRVTNFIRNMFPDNYTPGVVLAVPGHLQVDEVEGQRLPRFEVLWDDQHSSSDAVIKRRWAAENAKRFLAAQIAVGTIDQAMMAALQVRHAHVRAACLARSLLVVDEVHASKPIYARYPGGLAQSPA